MKKLLIGALMCALVPFSHAQESAEPVNSVLQLFSCNLNPGQNTDDVWSLLEALREQVTSQTNQNDGIGMFLWLPFRSASEYDYIWGATNTDLVATMDGLAEYAASGSGQALASRFESVNARCHSMIAMSEQVHVSSTPFDPADAGDRMPDGLVETFSCKNRAGSDMNAVRGATAFWQEQMKKIGSAEMNKYDGYLVTPFRGGTGEADWGWIGAFPDMGSFGRGMTDYMNSKGGQAADARFEKVSTCRSALWTGYWVRAPGS